MGYDVHITRKENWFDEDDSRNISIEEWKNLVTNDPEMRLDNFAEATTLAGATVNVNSEGLSVWTKFSGDGLNGNHAWFSYENGEICVKNPDNEILGKMIEIARMLNAKVQGDENEVYELSDTNEITTKYISHSTDKVAKKAWWKFW